MGCRPHALLHGFIPCPSSPLQKTILNLQPMSWEVCIFSLDLLVTSDLHKACPWISHSKIPAYYSHLYNYYLQRWACIADAMHVSVPNFWNSYTTTTLNLCYSHCMQIQHMCMQSDSSCGSLVSCCALPSVFLVLKMPSYILFISTLLHNVFFSTCLFWHWAACLHSMWIPFIPLQKPY